MDSKEQVSTGPIQFVKIEVYKFVSNRQFSSLTEIVHQFLKEAESDRLLINQLYISSPANNKHLPGLFMKSLKNKITRICFIYLYTRSHDFLGEGQDQSKDEMLQRICSQKLQENKDLKDVVQIVLDWLKEDEVFKAKINEFPRMKIFISIIEGQGQKLVKNLQQFNPSEKKETRKREWDALLKEMKVSQENFEDKKTKLTQFRVDHLEVNNEQLSIFEEFIVNVMNYIFFEKFPELKLTSPKQSNSLTQYDDLGSIFHDNENNDDMLFSPPLPKYVHPAKQEQEIIMSNFNLAKEGMQIFVENHESEIQNILNAFKVGNGEYVGLPMVGNQYSIFIPSHVKIIQYFISKQLEPGEQYKAAKVNWVQMLQENQIAIWQFDEINADGKWIEPPPKRARRQLNF